MTIVGFARAGRGALCRLAPLRVPRTSLVANAGTTAVSPVTAPYSRTALRGMKYNLFPRVDFLAYLKKIHVAYHPGRDRTEVSRRLIMHMTAAASKKKFPNLEATWELLGYDAPATIDVEFVDGRKKRFLAEHYSRHEMQNIIDVWQFEHHLQHMKEHSLEKPDDED
eukprot:TRINITY_DN70970_c0_g1_i1.p1 TRINITY_DN70970_c0_g1~~TRINITY_DN70970_c0_g1_i1.p1  ORF type:complete len:184 (-),score=29.92 TRINITY_DN70970_c0_g1_i1:46-546(-)